MTLLFPLCIGIVIGVFGAVVAMALCKASGQPGPVMPSFPPPEMDQASELRERVSLEAIERGFKRSAS